MISSSVTWMSNSLGSISLTAMLIPCLQESIPIGADDLSDCIELPRGKTVVLVQSYGFKPELTDKLITLNVNMLWFIAVEAVEVESVWSCNTFYGRHDLLILLSLKWPSRLAFMVPLTYDLRGIG